MAIAQRLPLPQPLSVVAAVAAEAAGTVDPAIAIAAAIARVRLEAWRRHLRLSAPPVWTRAGCSLSVASGLACAVLTNARLVTSRKFLSRTTGFSHSSLLDTSPWVKNEGRLSKHRKKLDNPAAMGSTPTFSYLF